MQRASPLPPVTMSRVGRKSRPSSLNPWRAADYPCGATTCVPLSKEGGHPTPEKTRYAKPTRPPPSPPKYNVENFKKSRGNIVSGGKGGSSVLKFFRWLCKKSPPGAAARPTKTKSRWSSLNFWRAVEYLAGPIFSTLIGKLFVLAERHVFAADRFRSATDAPVRTFNPRVVALPTNTSWGP